MKTPWKPSPAAAKSKDAASINAKLLKAAQAKANQAANARKR